MLLADPGYGEYAHVAERVIGCQVDRFRLRRDEGWRIDPARRPATTSRSTAEGRPGPKAPGAPVCSA